MSKVENHQHVAAPDVLAAFIYFSFIILAAFILHSFFLHFLSFSGHHISFPSYLRVLAS